MRIRNYRWILYLCYALLVVGTFFIRPVADDWNCAAYPRFDFRLSDLLPQGSFWRPIENLLGGVLGLLPGGFPFVNHLAVVVMFTLAAWTAGRILRVSGIRAEIVDVARWVILLSPAGMATLFSIDAINQAGAALFGLLSIYVYLTRTGRRRVILWLLCAWCAVFFKESGIAYFLVSPLFAFALTNPEWKSFFRPGRWLPHLLIGIACVGLYFGARMLLSSGAQLFSASESSNYAMHLSPMNVVKNLALLTGSALTTIDTIALFGQPRNLLLVILSFLGGAPLLMLSGRYFVQCLYNGAFRVKYLLLTALVLCIASPHLLMDHCGEMHAYSVLPIVVLLVAQLFQDAHGMPKSLGIALFLYFAAAIGVDAHKYVTMYRCGLSGEELVVRIDEQSQRRPRRVGMLEVQREFPRYSVFYSSPGDSFFQGEYYRWRKRYAYPEEIRYEALAVRPDAEAIARQAEAYRARGFDCLWIVDGAEVTVVEL